MFIESISTEQNAASQALAMSNAPDVGAAPQSDRQARRPMPCDRGESERCAARNADVIVQYFAIHRRDSGPPTPTPRLVSRWREDDPV